MKELSEADIIHKESNRRTVFKDITNQVDLVGYLSDSAARLVNSKFVYHYTTVRTLQGILRTRKWHLGNAKYSNDLLEYENGDPLQWPNLFFGSFMAESSESIGMWSMYAQPWDQGVKIAIASSALRHWVDEIFELYEVDLESKKLTGRIAKSEEAKISLTSVVYCNTDSRNDSYAIEKIMWSNQPNSNFFDVAHIKQLTGYVKDDAWSYEKEIRLRVEFKNQVDFQRIAVNIPDEVMNSMVVYPSPKYAGDIDEHLASNSKLSIRTKNSLFSGKLSLKNACDDCLLKNRL